MSFVLKFEEKVKNTIERFELIDEHDKTIVACSGGKDSTTTLYLLHKFGYKLKAMIIDLLIGEWSKRNLYNIEKFCTEHGIKLHIVNLRKEFGYSMCYIRSIIQSNKKLTNCAICGVIKKWLLNKKARKFGATKIATGHNLDDEVETILMNVLKGNPELSLTLGPKTGVITDKKFIPRVKPLYFCTNEEVEIYARKMKLPVISQPCPCASGTLRTVVRKWIKILETKNSNIKMKIIENFLNSLNNLRTYNFQEKLKYCSLCGEPSRGKICKRCELLRMLK